MSGVDDREVSRPRARRILSVWLGLDSVGGGEARERFDDWRDQLSRACWRQDSDSSVDDRFAGGGHPPFTPFHTHILCTSVSCTDHYGLYSPGPLPSQCQ